jgi:hypothetical protein
MSCIDSLHSGHFIGESMFSEFETLAEAPHKHESVNVSLITEQPMSA